LQQNSQKSTASGHGRAGKVSHAYNIGAIFRLCNATLVECLVVAGVEVNLRNRHLVKAARGTTAAAMVLYAVSSRAMSRD
jgi:tRNA G18 (ribose-2'-O)-methylase SpoU